MLRRALLAAAAVVIAGTLHAAPSVGRPAPEFSLKNSAGSTVKLADYRGKYVDIPKAVNYVRQGLAEAVAGKPISAAVTRAYGCSIKY